MGRRLQAFRGCRAAARRQPRPHPNAVPPAAGAARARYPMVLWHFLTTDEGRMRLYR